MTRREEVATYSYRRPDGSEAFQRVKYRWPVLNDDGSVFEWKKDFYPRHRCRMSSADDGDESGCGWRNLTSRAIRCDGTWHTGLPYYTDDRGRDRVPTGVNALLYRLPEVLEAVRRGDPVWWAEGEKDANALTAAGVCGTSHHQGAEVGATRGQARWLRRARRVVLIRDRDEAGALDVVRRLDLLLSIGVPARRIEVVRAAGIGNKDAHDHLQRGFTVADFWPEDVMKLRAIAVQYRPPGRPRRAYRPGRAV